MELPNGGTRPRDGIDMQRLLESTRRLLPAAGHDDSADGLHAIETSAARIGAGESQRAGI